MATGNQEDSLSAPLDKWSGELTLTTDGDIPYVSRAIKVRTAGLVECYGVSDSGYKLEYLAAGVWHPMRCKKIRSTGTTAIGVSIGS